MMKAWKSLRSQWPVDLPDHEIRDLGASFVAVPAELPLLDTRLKAAKYVVSGPPKHLTNDQSGHSSTALLALILWS